MARIQSLTTIPSVSNTDVLAIEHNTGTGTYKVPISMLLSDVYSKSEAVAKTDIVDDLNSTETQKPGSANMLRALKTLLDAGYASISGSVTATSLSDFDAALTTACSGLAYGESRYIEVYPNWSSSLSNGVVSLARIYRVNVAGTLYQCYIFFGGAQGYYYSDAWHWQKPTQTPI